MTDAVTPRLARPVIPLTDECYGIIDSLARREFGLPDGSPYATLIVPDRFTDIEVTEINKTLTAAQFHSKATRRSNYRPENHTDRTILTYTNRYLDLVPYDPTDTTPEPVVEMTNDDRDRLWPEGWEFHSCPVYEGAKVSHSVKFHGRPSDPPTLPSGLPIIRATPFTDTNLMYWRDGKPWCRTHNTCLTPAWQCEPASVNDEHLTVCASCMQIAWENKTWPAPAPETGDPA